MKARRKIETQHYYFTFRQRNQVPIVEEVRKMKSEVKFGTKLEKVYLNKLVINPRL